MNRALLALASAGLLASAPVTAHTMTTQPNSVETLLGQASSEQVKELLRNPGMGWMHKQLLVKKIAQVNPDKAFGVLSEVFTDESYPPRTRAFAVEAMGKLGDLRAVDIIGEASMHELPPVLERSMLSALGQLRSPWSAFVLLRYLDADTQKDYNLRAEAIRSLGHLGTKSAIKPLLELLSTGGGEQQQIEIVRALGNLATTEALDAISTLLTTTKSSALQSEILTVLENNPDTSYAASVASLIDNPNSDLKSRALYLLGNYGDAAAMNSIISAYNTLPTISQQFATNELLEAIELKTLFLKTMAKIHPYQAEQLFIQASKPLDFTSNDARVQRAATQLRLAAINALTQVSSKAVSDFWLTAALDSDASVEIRVAYANAVSQINSARSRQRLTTILHDGHPQVRMAAINALGRTGSSDTQELLLTMLKDTHPSVTSAVRAALNLSTEGTSLGDMMQVLDDAPVADALAPTTQPSE